MKKLFIGLLFLASVGATFIGCELQNNEVEIPRTMHEKSAVNSNFQNIISEVEQLEEVKSMALVDERVFKTDFYKILVLDFESSESSSSVLIVLHLDDGYATLTDSRSVRFVNIQEGLNISGEIEVVSDDETPFEINGGKTTVLVCSGGCCFWSQVSTTHFLCDCIGVVSVDISTGSGCKVNVSSGKR